MIKTGAVIHPLVRLVDRSGLSERQLAGLIGVSQQAVWQWIRNARVSPQYRVPAERARVLAAIFDVPPSVLRPDLFDDSGGV